MVNSRLTIVVFTHREDIAYIPAFYGIVTVLVHQLVSGFHMALVVARRARSFVVHHQFHAFRVCVVVQCFEVEVGVRSYKVKHIVLFVSKPVFPTYIPTFHEHLVEAVFRRKIDVFAYFFVGSAVGTIRFSFGVIHRIKVYCRKVVGITPRVFTGNHFPPNAHILHRFNPRSIGNSARFVEVEDKA